MGFERLLPTEELLFRELVAAACFLTGEHVVRHGGHDRCLAAERPPFDIGWRQLGIGQAGSATARRSIGPPFADRECPNQPHAVGSRGLVLVSLHSVYNSGPIASIAAEPAVSVTAPRRYPARLSANIDFLPLRFDYAENE